MKKRAPRETLFVSVGRKTDFHFYYLFIWRKKGFYESRIIFRIVAFNGELSKQSLDTCQCGIH
jgi:hypothetical protein